MNKVRLVLVAIAGVLLSSCGSKTEADFSIVPVIGSSGEYQYIDVLQKGKIVINPQFGQAHLFRDGLALVKTSGKDGKYGYIDKNGKFAIAPVYNQAQNFSDGTAWVQMENQPPTLIDKKGKMLLQIDSLWSALPFNDGTAGIVVYSQGQKLAMFIDKNGKPIATTEIAEKGIPLLMKDGLYAFQDKGTGKWGYKNKSGEIAINAQFDGTDMFKDGMATVKNGDKWGVIDKKGDFVINPQYDHLQCDGDGLFLVRVGKKYGWINKKGEIIINPQFDYAFVFGKNKLAPVQIGQKTGYIDKKGQIVINPQFEVALPFQGDYAMVANDDDKVIKVGFIDNKGNFVVTPLYYLDASDVGEYSKAIKENLYALSMSYFNPNMYERLEEKIGAFAEAEIEAERKKFEEEVGNAIPELETEAKNWQNGASKYKAKDGKFFSFNGKGKEDDNGSNWTWTATSKVSIGDCPANSIWKMKVECGENGDCYSSNEVSPKCQSITPKIITDYANGVEEYEGY